MCFALYIRRDNHQVSTAAGAFRRTLHQRGDCLMEFDPQPGAGELATFLVIEYPGVTAEEFRGLNVALLDEVTDLDGNLIAQGQEQLDLVAFRGELDADEKEQFDRSDGSAPETLVVSDGVTKTRAAVVNRPVI